MSETVLQECEAIDVVVRQEYDFTIGEIARANGDLSGLLGITYREGGNIVRKADRPWTEDLDTLPFVSKIFEKFLNPADYCYAFAQRPMIQVFSARGCPFQCNFCSYPETMSGRRFRRRSVKNFVDELQYIQDKMPEIREIFIEDDTFTVDSKRIIDICNEILARGLSIKWSCNTRVSLPDEVMAAMKEAGCRLLVVGYESGNQRVLDETRKGITLEESLAFAKNAKKHKLKGVWLLYDRIERR